METNIWNKGQEKKKGLSHIPVRISMWIHFCRIALCAEPNFFSPLSCQEKKWKKLAAKKKKERKKKKRGGWGTETLQKKNSHILHCSFSFKKKRCTWDKPYTSKYTKKRYFIKHASNYYHIVVGCQLQSWTQCAKLILTQVVILLGVNYLIIFNWYLPKSYWFCETKYLIKSKNIREFHT